MEYIFQVGIDDAQYLAREKIGRELTIEELERVRKGVEFGLECWEEVLIYAIQDIISENTTRNDINC